MQTDDETICAALDGIEYPCERADLIQHAASRGAGDGILGRLGGLPGRHYDGLATVRIALSNQRSTHQRP